jgi:ferredoxin
MGLERIILRLDACGGCPWASLRDRIQTQVDQAGQWLAHWEKDALLECRLTLDEQVERPLWDAKNPPLSRRDLFRLAAHQGQIVMARAMSQEPTGSNRHPGRNRLRLSNALAHLPEPTTLLDAPIETGDFAILSVSDECYACLICARACPTDALKFQVNDEKTHYWLYFNAQTCIGCEACIHVCAPEAIEIDKVPTFAQIFGESEPGILSEGELSKCVQCKTLFAADSDRDLCPVCEYRRKNPFGSMLPPGAKMIGKKFGGQKTHAS